MRTWFMLVAVLVAGIVQPALAQNRGGGNDKEDDNKIEVGDWAPDFEAEDWLNIETGHPPTLTELRGMVVVLFFWVNFSEGGENAMPFINIVENHFAFGKSSGVIVIGLTDAERRSVESQLRANKIGFPVGVKSKAAEEYQVTSLPAVVIIDPEGKIAHKETLTSADAVVNKLTEVLANIPPSRTHPAEAPVVARLIDEAREQLKSGDYRKSFRTALRGLQRAVTGDPLKAEAFAIIDLLERIGYDELAPVNALLEDKKYKEAAAVLRKVKKDFRGLGPGQDARSRFDQLAEDDEGFKGAVGAQGDEKAAAKSLLEAIEDLRKRRVGEAYVKLKGIMTEHAATEAAGYAGPMIERMKANPSIWSAAMDYEAGPECRRLLAQARSYRATGRADEARTLFSKVMNEYTGTSWAEDAKRELASMQP